MVAAFARLSRLKFLAGGFIGGGLGMAVAAYEGHAIDWTVYALAQAAVTALHLMTHYANDFFDRASDALAARTPFSGGSGVLVDGSLNPRVAIWAAGICGALGLGGAALLVVEGRPLAALGVLVIAVLAWAYSAPPLRLLGRGLGELDTALVVAVCVPLCTYAAQTAKLDARIVAATLAPALAMFVMMLAVEYPDVEPDAASGKRNLVVRLGRGRARGLVWAGLLSIGLSVLGALAAGAPLTLVPLLAVAIWPAAALWKALRTGDASVTHDAEIAGRGVTLFFAVGFSSLLGFLVAVP